MQRVCKLRGWAKDTPKNKETYDVMMEIWTGLRSKADKDNDGQVRLSSSGCGNVAAPSVSQYACVCVCSYKKGQLHVKWFVLGIAARKLNGFIVSGESAKIHGLHSMPLYDSS